MKNYLQLFTVIILILTIGLGCSFMSSGEAGAGSNQSNRTLTDKAVDKTVGRSNIGVPECDQVIDAIEAEMNNPDDNFVVKAAKATILNRIKDGIRESVEQNQNDKAELAKTCREFKTQFDAYKAEEQKKNANN
jgi:hypothetical protein